MARRKDWKGTTRGTIYLQQEPESLGYGSGLEGGTSAAGCSRTKGSLRYCSHNELERILFLQSTCAIFLLFLGAVASCIVFHLWAEVVAQLVECLPSPHKVLGSIPSTTLPW